MGNLNKRNTKMILTRNNEIFAGDHNHIPFPEHPDKIGTTHPEENGGVPNPGEPGGPGNANIN